MKTLSDPLAARVTFRPRSTSVDALRRLRGRSVGLLTPRLLGPERITYRLRARLVKAKIEDDRDIHLVIADLRHPAHTMIVEFPSSGCEGAATSVKRTQLARARSSFVRACGKASSASFHELSGIATITGVGFFDTIHGQTGVARNGIELHPVLSSSAPSCRRTA